MNEYPILFSGVMVRAILAGAKTQTRRVVRPGPLRGGAVDSPLFWSPFGVPGDRLWVREIWKFLGTDMMRHGRTHSVQDGVFSYQADGSKRTIERPWRDVERYMTSKQRPDRWRPSIHMPRWVSRLTLEVTAVRVERLQEIDNDDAEAEGCPGKNFRGIPDENDTEEIEPREEFARLWDKINGKRAPWSSDPFCWVVSFRRVEP